MIYSLLLSASAGAPPQSLPYTEVFGDEVSTSCTSHWIGECEKTWTGFGQFSSLRLMEGTDGTVAAFIKPRSGASAMNGITKTFSVTAKALMEFSMSTTVVDPQASDVDGEVRLRFKRSNGQISAVYVKGFSVNEVQTVRLTEIVPFDAVTVQVIIGANKLPGSLTRLAITDIALSEEDDPPPSCTPPTCNCNISCQPPYTKIQNCGQTPPPECITIDVCYCQDPIIGIAPSQTLGWWDDWT